MIDGLRSLETAQVGEITYLFAAVDLGVIAFSVDHGGTLTYINTISTTESLSDLRAVAIDGQTTTGGGNGAQRAESTLEVGVGDVQFSRPSVDGTEIGR